MLIEEAKEYIKMIIRKQEIPDSAKALGYVYAVEAIDTVLNHIEKLEAESKNVVSRKKYRQTKKTLKGQIRKLNAVIEEMAKYIKEPYRITVFGSRKPKIEIIKEYFYKKVNDK